MTPTLFSVDSCSFHIGATGWMKRMISVTSLIPNYILSVSIYLDNQLLYRTYHDVVEEPQIEALPRFINIPHLIHRVAVEDNHQIRGKGLSH